MDTNSWWPARRFGVLVHTSLSNVPSWAPIGQYPEFYQAHVDGSVRDVMLHPSPMVETIAHHRDYWPQIERFDEFAPLNTFDQFDADEWAELITASGAGYAVLTARHHDGWCWWDAPATVHLSITSGPRRDIFGELIKACRARGLVAGASYSLLDWNSSDYPSTNYVQRVIHPQVLDLVTQHQVDLLYGSGHWGAGGNHWGSDELLEKVLAINPSVVINDRWWSKYAMLRSFEYSVPPDIISAPWEMRRGLGGGFGLNQAESDRQRLNAAGLAALYTEVIAKGGHLLLGVGADATGRVDDATADTMRQFGAWMAANPQLNRTRPWTTWGDDGHRYLILPAGEDNDGQRHTSTDPARGVLVAIDVAGDGSFAALGRSTGRIGAVTTGDGTPLDWTQSADELTVRRTGSRRRTGPQLPQIVHVEFEQEPSIPIRLFPSRPPQRLELGAVVGDATSGDVIHLGEGVYVGPATIPSGVTVRGLGPDRTILDGGATEAVVLSAGARLEHVKVTGGGTRIAWLPKPSVRLAGDGATLLGCNIDGHVTIEAGSARVLSCWGSGVVASGGDNIEIRRCQFTGMGWDCTIEIAGGSGHEIEGCEINASLVGIRLVDVTDTTVRGNVLRTRWWGVLLVDCEFSRVLANGFRGVTRAVDVDGGTMVEVVGNAVSEGDSGCLVQRGATGVTVAGNRWDGLRVGLFVWDVGNITHHDNTAVAIAEAAEVWGP